MIKKILLWTLGLIAVFCLAGYIAVRVSPWPSALLIRRAFTKESINTSRALEKHLPSNVSAILEEQYDITDKVAHLDIFYPSEIENSERSLPTVVWIHGGGWVSGTKRWVSNYARIIAGKGYIVVSVDYSIAPGTTYPTPIRQVNTALSYLDKNAKRLHVDQSRFVLAGDSAGSHIVSQVANIHSVPSYADALGIKPSLKRSQLAGMILYCGSYDIGSVNLDGPFGGFLKTVLWSYSGTKNFKTEPKFATASVINYVTSEFPPSFISAGNADPLLPQSQALADKLTGLGVKVDKLFFPDNYTPALAHEYQFNLDTEAGRTALERSLKFLSSL